MSIPVVFEDEWISIVNKPSGLLTIPAPRQSSRTLTSLLNDELKQKGVAYRLHPCHRLDKETSGLIIYAKGKSAQDKMMDLFHQKKVRKVYTAFVQGLPVKLQGEINRPLEGQAALTRYRVVEKRKGYSIVDVEPLTGRSNQIRIHFKYLGYPLLGERKFAFRKDFTIKANRLCLHARLIEFESPFTHQKISVEAALPLGMQHILDKFV